MEKRRIVIIDDDLAFNEFLTKLVGTFGHEVIAKSDTTDSHTYELRDSDIVFLDLLMPQVNGLQVLERLAHQNSKCEIVVMSVDTQRLEEGEKLIKKLGLGFLGVLAKPFSVADVSAILQWA
ncbi:MAG: response regulator [Aestuariivirga sp.]